jgi:hypothetical protein
MELTGLKEVRFRGNPARMGIVFELNAEGAALLSLEVMFRKRLLSRNRTIPVAVFPSRTFWTRVESEACVEAPERSKTPFPIPPTIMQNMAAAERVETQDWRGGRLA